MIGVLLVLSVPALAQASGNESEEGEEADSVAAATAAADDADKFVVGTTGEARLIGSLPPDYQVDDEGHMVGQGFHLDSRLRVGLDLRRGSWRLGTEWDLFEGQLAGDPWDIRGEEDARDRHVVDVLRAESFQARELGIEGMVGKVALQAGLTTSHWGLGMVANDGDHDPFFGRNDFGDRVVRLRVASRPFNGGKTPLTFVLAGDRVVEDDTAEWSPLDGGDAAWQGVASAFWSEDGQTYGIYGVYRNQLEEDGERKTEVGVLDLYADQPITAGSWTIRLAAEAAGIMGTTERSQTYNARERLDVLSAGATALVQASPEGEKVRGVLRAGWASGDGDPDDGTTHDFSFDRDFDAGMVLFDEVQGALDAAAYAQLTDPAHSGGAPDGADAIVSEGAFKNAVFVQPVVGVRPLDWLDLQAGLMLAWSAKPPGQAFQSYRNGGVPANHLGQPTDGYALGTEIDWAVKVGDVDVDAVGITTRPALLVQGGHLLANDNLGVGTATLITVTGRLRW